MIEPISISDRINAFYDGGCRDPEMLTSFEAEPSRHNVDWVDATFETGKVHEPDYVVFGHFRDPATVVLDVGANYGYSVSSMCAAGCGSSVLSIEALPWYKDHLTRVRNRNPGRFDFRITGVGAAPAVLRFVTPVINGMIDSGLTSAEETNHRQNLAHNVEAVLASHDIAPANAKLKFIVSHLPIATLDEIVADYDGVLDMQRIEAMKLDVEGLEAEVLSGARTLLAEHRPLIMLEGANRKAMVRDIMAALGYRFARREENHLHLDEAICTDQANGFFVHTSRFMSYSDAGLLC